MAVLLLLLPTNFRSTKCINHVLINLCKQKASFGPIVEEEEEFCIPVHERLSDTQCGMYKLPVYLFNEKKYLSFFATRFIIAFKTLQLAWYVMHIGRI